MTLTAEMSSVKLRFMVEVREILWVCVCERGREIAWLRLDYIVSGVSSRAFQKHRSVGLCVPESDKDCVLSSV